MCWHVCAASAIPLGASSAHSSLSRPGLPGGRSLRSLSAFLHSGEGGVREEAGRQGCSWVHDTNWRKCPVSLASMAKQVKPPSEPFAACTTFVIAMHQFWLSLYPFPWHTPLHLLVSWCCVKIVRNFTSFTNSFDWLLEQEIELNAAINKSSKKECWL